MKLSNRWNLLIYRLWSPIYDGFIDHFFFQPGRQRALQVLAAQPGERLLLVGVGTGADLPLLPPGVIAIGFDLSPAMLAKAQQKLPLIATSVLLAIGDARHLPVGEAAFDTAILNLILSVVPDGNACLRETLRILKPGGKLIVFDKFVSEDRKPTLGRRFINFFSTLLGTDITRRFDQIAGDLELNLLHEEASLLKGTYRIILLSKPLIAAES
jgi:ubiquinone/menaquinone biosynthesis C-methylase UbiE